MSPFLLPVIHTHADILSAQGRKYILAAHSQGCHQMRTVSEQLCVALASFKIPSEERRQLLRIRAHWQDW